MAELLRAEAFRVRRAARADGAARAAALGVRLMLPLGVCVLPAFVLLGVAPLMISVISGTLGGAVVTTPRLVPPPSRLAGTTRKQVTMHDDDTTTTAPEAGRTAVVSRSAVRAIARRVAGERGAATAEYAVATMAAVGFAGLLVIILRGDEVRGILTDLVRNALTVG